MIRRWHSRIAVLTVSLGCGVTVWAQGKPAVTITVFRIGAKRRRRMGYRDDPAHGERLHEVAHRLWTVLDSGIIGFLDGCAGVDGYERSSMGEGDGSDDHNRFSVSRCACQR
jgi:hypothetical protein